MSQMGQYKTLNAAMETITTDDAFVVTPVAGNINLIGGSNLHTTGALGSAIINLDDNVSITGTFDAVGDITSAGGDLISDTGDLVAILGNVAAIVGNVSAGGNITAGDEVTAVNDIITSTGNIVSTLGAGSFATSVTAGTGVNVLTGNVDIISGSLELPATTVTDGQILIDSTYFMHAYGNENTFVGHSSGNFSLTGVTNTGLGINTLTSITSGHENVALGAFAGAQLMTGNNNTMVGRRAGVNYTGAEDSNICFGNTGTLAESHKIRIGTQGAGADQQDNTFIAGIHGVTPGAATEYAIIDANGEMGSTAAIGVTSVTAGTNLNNSGTATDPVINLNDSISLAGTVTAATGMIITANDLTISSGKIDLPTTSSTDGQIRINSKRVFHTYGTNNLFIGEDAGNFTTTGTGENIAIGSTVLDSLTSGIRNCAIGRHSQTAITSGDFNCSIGVSSLFNVSSSSGNMSFGYASLYYCTGNQNTAIGTIAGWNLVGGNYNTMIGPCTNPPTNTIGVGSSYTGSETSNILLSNTGTVGESNKIRIGTQGTGNGQQNACYVAGIYGVTPGGTVNAALVDSNGQLGSVATLGVANGGTGATTLTDHGILLGSAAGAITALGAATNGQIPIGSTGADPTLATIAEGTNIDVTNAAGSITLETTKTELDVQTGTTYTLVLGDRGKTVTLNNAAAITLNVPPNASVAFATGTVISLAQLGAGQVTVAPGAAVTIRSDGSKLKLSAQYAMAALTKIGSDEWILAGSLSA